MDNIFKTNCCARRWSGSGGFAAGEVARPGRARDDDLVFLVRLGFIRLDLTMACRRRRSEYLEGAAEG
jgi:hypothetical protein